MITAKMYLNRSKDSNWETGRELGLSEEAMKKFVYALYEVELDVLIDEVNGAVSILKVNGMDLVEPVSSSR